MEPLVYWYVSTLVQHLKSDLMGWDCASNGRLTPEHEQSGNVRDQLAIACLDQLSCLDERAVIQAEQYAVSIEADDRLP